MTVFGVNLGKSATEALLAVLSGLLLFGNSLGLHSYCNARKKPDKHKIFIL